MTLFLGAYDDKRRLCRVQIMTRQAQTMPVALSGPLVCFVWLLLYYYIVTLLVVRVMINCLLKLIETPTSHDFVDFSELTSSFLFFIFYHHCRCHPWCTTTATTLHPQAMLVATCHVMVTTWSSTWLVVVVIIDDVCFFLRCSTFLVILITYYLPQWQIATSAKALPHVTMMIMMNQQQSGPGIKWPCTSSAERPGTQVSILSLLFPHADPHILGTTSTGTQVSNPSPPSPTLTPAFQGWPQQPVLCDWKIGKYHITAVSSHWTLKQVPCHCSQRWALTPHRTGTSPSMQWRADHTLVFDEGDATLS